MFGINFGADSKRIPIPEPILESIQSQFQSRLSAIRIGFGIGIDLGIEICPGNEIKMDSRNSRVRISYSESSELK